MAKSKKVRTTVLYDALHNLDPDAVSNPEYARGVLVGVMAAVMHFKACEWHEAVDVVRPFLPRKIEPQAVPDGWHEQLTRPRATETGPQHIHVDHLRMTAEGANRVSAGVQSAATLLLIGDIRDHGVMLPLVVLPDLTVVSGNRRLAAARFLGRETVPCEVVEPDDPRANPGLYDVKAV